MRRGVGAALAAAFGVCLCQGALGALGTLRVGTCSEGYAPMVIRGADNTFYGLEVDQWNAIFRLMAARVDKTDDPVLKRVVGDQGPPPLMGIRGLGVPEAGLRAVQEGELDIAFCGYYLTPDRVNVADPSPPLLSSGYTMVTNARIVAPTDSELISGTFPEFRPGAVFAFLFLMCMSVVYSHGIWLLEKSSNVGLSNAYGWGIFDGFYMAMTAASTSGYGDLVPVTFFGKLLTAAWILTGIYCMAMFGASITTGIVTNNIRTPIESSVQTPSDMIGLRVGTYFSAAQRTVDIVEPRVGTLIQYSSVQWAYSSLARGDLDVILDDVRNAQYQVARQPYGGRFVIGGDPFMPTDYGIYMARPNGTTHPLYPFFYRAVLEYTRGELNVLRNIHVGKWLTDAQIVPLSDEADRIIEETLMYTNHKMIAVLASVLFVAVVATFVSMREERRSNKENSILLSALGVDHKKKKLVDIYTVKQGAAKLFERFDLNRDGHLEMSEITAALTSIGISEAGLTEKLKKEAFLSGTPMEKEDGSCWLSLQDFQVMMQRIALEGFDSSESTQGNIRGAPAELQHLMLLLNDLRDSSQEIEGRMDTVQCALQDLNDLGVMGRVREAVAALRGIETRPLGKGAPTEGFNGKAPAHLEDAGVSAQGGGSIHHAGVTVDAAIESMHGQVNRLQGGGAHNARPKGHGGTGPNVAGGPGGARGGGKPGQLHTQALEALLMARSATLGKAELEVGGWEEGGEGPVGGGQQGGRVAAIAQRMASTTSSGGGGG